MLRLEEHAPGIRTPRPVALFFVAGVACGSSGVVAWQRMLSTLTKTQQAETFRREYVRMMKQRLTLSDEQTVKLNDTLDHTKNRVHEIRRRIEPQLHAIRDQQYLEICEFLTPIQKAEYDRIRAERASKR